MLVCVDRPAGRAVSLCSIVVLLFLTALTTSQGQGMLNVANVDIQFVGNTVADQRPCAPLDMDNYNMNVPNNLLGAYDISAYANIISKSNFKPCGTDSKVSAQAMGLLGVSGVASPEVTMRWVNVSQCFANVYNPLADCDCFACGPAYSADSDASIDITVDLVVQGLGGLTATLWHSWNAFGGAATRHEGNDEDPATSAPNRIYINGVEQTAAAFDFDNPPGLSGWNRVSNQSAAASVQDGDVISIVISSKVKTHIELPGKDYSYCKIVDQASARFSGNAAFFLVPFGAINPIPPTLTAEDDGLGCTFFDFSLDIGSDSELSDPHQDGDEFFDPGDVYEWSGWPLVGFSNGKLDDATIFGGDPAPNSPGSMAPVEQGLPADDVNFDFFDLDGHDQLDFSLLAQSYGPGLAPIALFASDCVHSGEFVFVSYDDDDAQHHTAFASSVPVNSINATVGGPMGASGNNDEVVGLDLSVSTVGAPVLLGSYSVLDELGLHVNLDPNPDGAEEWDDDVDALDIPQANCACESWYFSPDHEATFYDPGPVTTLNPGSVYEVLPGGGFAEAINGATHLGISADADVDAFEFVWQWNQTAAVYALALFFSVDDDDPYTVADESGGLNPGAIYRSFLDGSFTEVMDGVADIDAIAAWNTSLQGLPLAGGTADAALTVYPKSIIIGMAAGMDVLEIGNRGSAPLNWNAVVTVGSSWLSVLPASGIDNGIVNVMWTDNTTGNPRVGTITISSPDGQCPDQTVTVTQLATPKQSVEPQQVQAAGFRLEQNRPNPFSEKTTMTFLVPEAAELRIEVLDQLGRPVALLAEGSYAPGSYSLHWDGRDAAGAILANGSFHCRLIATGAFGSVTTGIDLQLLR